MVKVTFEVSGYDYFPVKSVSLTHSLQRSIGMKSTTITAIPGRNFKDFLLELHQKKVMLCRLSVDDKIFMEGFINDRFVHYSDRPNGATEVKIRLLDRFIGIVASDIITSRPKGSLQSFISDILTETGYVSSLFINTYQRKITNARDFLKVSGAIDINKPLKAYQRSSLVEENASDLLGECLAMNKLILISNGYDSLTFEDPTDSGDTIFNARRTLEGSSLKKFSNIISLEKYGEMGGQQSLTPSVVITLNSYQKSASKDSNTSVISPNAFGIPHIIKLNRVNMQASYQDIQGMMNFAFAGIKARSNSYVINLAGVIFDDFGNFFQPNRKVHVYDEKYGLDYEMLIMDTKLDIDAQSGSNLKLNVAFQESFQDNVTIKTKGRL